MDFYLLKKKIGPFVKLYWVSILTYNKDIFIISK